MTTPNETTSRSDWDRTQTAVLSPTRARTLPRFVLARVLTEGLLRLAGDLYDLRFHERRDIALPHLDERAFDVMNDDGAPLGLIVFDLIYRPEKCACSNQGQSLVLADRSDHAGVRQQVVMILQNEAESSDSELSLDQVMLFDGNVHFRSIDNGKEITVFFRLHSISLFIFLTVVDIENNVRPLNGNGMYYIILLIFCAFFYL